MNLNRIWIISGTVVAVIIALLGWFLGVKPQLDSASDADTQASAAQQQLQLSKTQLASLRKQFEGLDSLRAQLGTLRQSVPGAPELSDFVRELSTEGAASGAAVVSETIGDASPITVPTALPAPTSTSVPVPQSTLNTHAKLPVGAFFSLPVTIQASGTSDQITDFVSRLQNYGQRLFLVSSVTTSSQGASTTATISGLIYVLSDAATPAPTPAG